MKNTFSSHRGNDVRSGGGLMSEPAPCLSVLPDADDDEDARQQVALIEALPVTVQPKCAPAR